jgi:tryptophan synthase alpha chain
MSRIAEAFKTLAGRGEKALITFITAGDPALDVTRDCILAMERGGADIVELGVPFSDPMADGPTIQQSSERALQAGTTLPKILAMVKSVRSTSEIPLLLMGYYNPIFRYGTAQFVTDAAAAGLDGVLIVDLPPEEAQEFKNLASAVGIDLISLLTPTSDAERMKKVARQGSGFIYYVSVTGVTGARESVAVSVSEKVEEIRRLSPLPVAVGFGVSDPSQAARVAGMADGVVVGSAIVKLFERFKGGELVDNVEKFIAALKNGIRTN